jgi:transposase
MPSALPIQLRGNLNRKLPFQADSLSAHKTRKMHTFLAEHPYLHLHFTPTYYSWLNQIELLFAKIGRDVVARSVFTPVLDLKSKPMRCICQSSKKTRKLERIYVDP